MTAVPLLPAVGREQLFALQRAAGNQTASTLIANVPGPHGPAPVQRAIAWRNQQDKNLDQLAAAIEKIVTQSADDILDDPLTMPVPVDDGYIRRWTNVYSQLVASGGQIPPFLYTAFGYAVESVAGYRLLNGGTPALPAGHELVLQLQRGMTRPDIVIRHTATQKALAWFDITSTGSETHINNKSGTGWKTTPYVAEFLYPSLDANMLGRANRTPAQAAKVNVAARAARAEYAQRITMLYEYLTEKRKLMGTNAKDNRETIQGLLAAFLDAESLSLNATRSLIMLPTEADNFTHPSLMGAFGFKGSHANGRDRHTAEELLYSKSMT